MKSIVLGFGFGLALVASSTLLAPSMTTASADDIFGGSFYEQEEFHGMSGRMLKKVISDRKLILNTPMGTTLPVSFSANGTMVGEGGSIAKYLSGRKLVTNDTGKWWISRNRLCQRWDNWLDSKMTCFQARKVGKKVYWQSDAGDSGTATLGPALTTAASAQPQEQSRDLLAR